MEIDFFFSYRTQQFFPLCTATLSVLSCRSPRRRQYLNTATEHVTNTATAREYRMNKIRT